MHQCVISLEQLRMKVVASLHLTYGKIGKPEASSTMRALSGARRTDARLYTLRIKIGTRTTSARERSHCWTHLWGVFNNASARGAIECFLSERKRSPRCLQALAFQVDRCIARKSKMATKTIMGFCEGLCTQYFQIRFSGWRCMFLCVNIWNWTI